MPRSGANPTHGSDDIARTVRLPVKDGRGGRIITGEGLSVEIRGWEGDLKGRWRVKRATVSVCASVRKINGDFCGGGSVSCIYPSSLATNFLCCFVF